MDQERIYNNGLVNYWTAMSMRRVPGANIQLSTFTCSEVLTAVTINIPVFLNTMQCIQKYTSTEESTDSIFRIWQFRLHCRWRQYAPSDLWYLYSFIHGVISQKRRIFMKTFRASKGIAAVISNLDTRRKGVVNLMPRSVYLRDRTRYPVNRGLVEPHSRSARRLREHKLLWAYLNSNPGLSGVKRSRYINSW